MIRRRCRRRAHFIFRAPEVSIQRPSEPYWMSRGISKVFGASPAIVFAPPEPIASIIRRKRINLGWIKLQAIQNGGADHIRGYDDGECEPQVRGIHP